MTYEEVLKLTKSGLEIWKPIPGYEDCYEISNFGKVKSIERIVKCGKHTIHVKEHMKKSFIGTLGYHIIMLSKNGKPKPFGLHRILAETFIPNPENKPEIDHINTNRADCSLNNLRWVTHRENTNNIITMQNKRETTYSPETNKKRLETKRNKNSNCAPIYVYQYTKEGILVNSYYSISEAERNTKIRHIHSVLNNPSRSAGGYIWTSIPSDNIKYQRKNPNKRCIQLYDKEGNLLNEWKSIAAASRDLDIPYNSIQCNLNSTYPSKYNFKYKEEEAS